MNGAQVLDVARESIVTLLMVSGPLMAVALIVGIIIALFQALTSIQEATLTFVPKILLVFALMLVLLPFMSARLQSLTNDLFARMANPDNEQAGTTQ
ncbi:MAG TPA: flagellar biosynthesis protein FliQ [Alphaproteobacteria bacterium]|nr:flagellar biosynthesis protein FliQ [Alphaproteobacteria bacterium]